MKRILALLLMLLLCTMTVVACAKKKNDVPAVPQKVVLGVERLQEPEVQAKLAGKRLGLYTNQSGVDSHMTSSIDVVKANNNLVSIFAPEHGVFGAVAAGETFDSTHYKGMPVHSLYGDLKHPKKEMLDDIDILLVDIQDVGVRHYTYFSSLAYLMESCAEYGKKIIVLDRPNPLGNVVQGPVLKPAQKSFIGLYEIPLRHGLTIGEFARYINKEENINCDLEVIPMRNYKGEMTWAETGLPWVQTSPQIPTADTAFVYAVTGMSGGTNMSNGLGTSKPFYTVGAPWVDAIAAKDALDALHIPGVAFRAAAWTPKYSKFEGQLVQGVEVVLLDHKQVNLAELGYLLIETFRKMYPAQFAIDGSAEDLHNSSNAVELELGEDSVTKAVPHEAAFARWQQEDAAFRTKAKPYLLYE